MKAKMIWQLDLSVLTLIVICAFATIMVKDLLSAAIIFGAYSFLMCILWTEMGAVDVAFTEASVGAGVSTVLFIAAVHQTSRKVKPRKSGRWLSKAVALLATLLTGLVLIIAEADFPGFADQFTPASLHVSPYYITQTLHDTNVPNMVTSVLADYRGFDTMFETAVIFTAGLAVIAILRRYKKDDRCELPEPYVVSKGYPDTIIRFVARQLVPFIQLFALYVVAHGHHSPGGGFQGGVILGASFILLAVSYDSRMIIGRMSERLNVLLGNIGVLIYAGIGFLCLLLGANFLDYSMLSKVLPATDKIMARSHGMLGIEIGVAIAVMAVVISIYINIISCGKYDKEE
jgi:multicomponent Na+:H+ antiporter subunit B